MTAPGRGVATSDDELSLFMLGAALLRHRRRIGWWALVLGVLALVPGLVHARTWTARASFVPQGSSDASPSGLRSLAGQFGVTLPGGGSSSQSPDFYEQILESPAILGVIADDTIAVAEDGGRRHSMAELLDVEAPNPRWGREETIRKLGDLVRPQLSAKTGVVDVSVQTRWPSVSLAIMERLLTALNTFNLETRQSQAAEERRFVEARLKAQQQSLSDAEDRLATFLQRNRQYSNSPELMFQHDHLQRDVDLQQQVLVGLAQSLEDARIREVRDVPVITVLDRPTLPARPDSRGIAVEGLAGAALGAILAVVTALISEMYARRRAEGDSDATRFAALWSDWWAGVSGRSRRQRVRDGQ